ncbi:MAG: YihY/virulence factor BrkB family protein [Rubrobacteraceae bacterium]
MTNADAPADKHLVAGTPGEGRSSAFASTDGGPRRPKPGWASSIIELGGHVTRNFFEHRIATYAAALAYRGLFGLFPFVLILVVLAGVLGVPDSLARFIEGTGVERYREVPQQLEPVVEPGREQILPLVEMLEQAQEQAGSELLVFGIIVALWSVSAVARTLIDAFNTVYGVAEARPWWKTLALSVASGPILALAVIFAMGLMLTGPQMVERVTEVVGLDALFIFLWRWLRFPVALTLLGGTLSIVYRYGPNTGQRFRSVMVGAAFAVVAWAVVSIGFSIYLANFADYGVTYGSLGAAVGLLLYLYLSASIVLVGAEVNAAIYYRPADR